MTTGSHDYSDDPRNAAILISVNGALKPRGEAMVSVFDSGFVLGDGVWEGLRLIDGGIAFLDAHLDRLYEGAKAPFSWTPESVEVLASGTLAHSSGPVLDAGGKRVGTFNSIWRREKDGKWRVVFDKGCEACICQPAS